MKNHGVKCPYCGDTKNISESDCIVDILICGECGYHGDVGLFMEQSPPVQASLPERNSYSTKEKTMKQAEEYDKEHRRRAKEVLLDQNI